MPIIEDILSDEDFEIMKERNGSIEIDSDEPIIKKIPLRFLIIELLTIIHLRPK